MLDFMKVGDSRHGSETAVGAAVRWELQEILGSGPLTEKNVKRMLGVVEHSLPLLQTVMGGNPRKGFGGVIAGRPTPLGVIPLDEFQDAWGAPGSAMSFLGNGHARYALTLARIAVRRGRDAMNRRGDGSPVEAKPLEPALRSMLERLLAEPYVPVNAKRIQRLLDAILRLMIALGPTKDRVVTTNMFSSGLPGLSGLWGAGIADDFVSLSNPVGEIVGDVVAGAADLGGPALAPSPPSETFGAKLVREILAMVPVVANARNNTPENLVMAIATAEREGMPELAAKLRKTLGVERPEEGEDPITSAEDESAATVDVTMSDGHVEPECTSDCVVVTP